MRPFSCFQDMLSLSHMYYMYKLHSWITHVEFAGRRPKFVWAEDEQSGGGLSKLIIGDLGTLQRGT